MSLAGFEPAFPGTKRRQAYALDRAATGIGGLKYQLTENKFGTCSSCGSNINLSFTYKSLVIVVQFRIQIFIDRKIGHCWCE
jgi:hypothetical protein